MNTCYRGFCRKKPALEWALESFKIDPGDLFTIKIIFFRFRNMYFKKNTEVFIFFFIP